MAAPMAILERRKKSGESLKTRAGAWGPIRHAHGLGMTEAMVRWPAQGVVAFTWSAPNWAVRVVAERAIAGVPVPRKIGVVSGILLGRVVDLWKAGFIWPG